VLTSPPDELVQPLARRRAAETPARNAVQPGHVPSGRGSAPRDRDVQPDERGQLPRVDLPGQSYRPSRGPRHGHGSRGTPGAGPGPPTPQTTPALPLPHRPLRLDADFPRAGRARPIPGSPGTPADDGALPQHACAGAAGLPHLQGAMEISARSEPVDARQDLEAKSDGPDQADNRTGDARPACLPPITRSASSPALPPDSRKDWITTAPRSLR
jgi:hypothetical protein